MRRALALERKTRSHGRRIAQALFDPTLADRREVMDNLDRFHPFGAREAFIHNNRMVGIRNFPQHNPYRKQDRFFLGTAAMAAVASGGATVLRQAFVGWPALSASPRVAAHAPPFAPFGVRVIYLGTRAALVGFWRGFATGGAPLAPGCVDSNQTHRSVCRFCLRARARVGFVVVVRQRTVCGTSVIARMATITRQRNDSLNLALGFGLSSTILFGHGALLSSTCCFVVLFCVFFRAR